MVAVHLEVPSKSVLASRIRSHGHKAMNFWYYFLGGNNLIILHVPYQKHTTYYIPLERVSILLKSKAYLA